MSKATRAFKVDPTITALKTVGDIFGIGDALAKQVEDSVDDFALDGVRWAVDTAEDWFNSAPWATGNLRESIDVDESDPTKPAVFVNVKLLMANMGRSKKTIRRGYHEHEIYEVTMPDYNYLEEAEKYAVSASISTNPVQPNSARESNWMPPGPRTPFLNTIWEELAKKNKRLIFNGR